MMNDNGIKATSVMWAMTLVSFVFVPLRLYTRIYIVKAIGIDDHVFNLAWVFLLLYTVFINIAAVHGFGQRMDTLETDSAVKAVYNELIGQTFAVLGMAIAKISLGSFLLRIVIKQWHRISIWFSMVSLATISLMTAIILWTQRLPSESIYDPRVPGRTVVSVTPFSVMLGVWCAVVDFYFALLPWIFIWNLNMNFKEKMSIAISLSLGFIACIFGIIRTIDVQGLSSVDNYTEDTVDLIIWSGVELGVTLICNGIPTIRPLYRVIVHGSRPDISEGRYAKNEDTNDTGRFRMQNIAKGVTAFNVVNEGHTESYSRFSQSDEEGLVGQDARTNAVIRIREEVRIESEAAPPIRTFK